MKRIRGGSGFGDAIYVRVVADHLISQGHEVEACSDYADVFIESGAKVSPFRRDRIDVLCHYSAKKCKTDTTQWQDVCDTSRVGNLPLHINWKIRNTSLVKSLRRKANGRQLIVVHGGRAPMGRTDGFGQELMPCAASFKAVLSWMQDSFIVRIGNGKQHYKFPAHIDMNGQTSVSDVMDVFADCDGVIAQCSFAVPLAECFDKPLLAIWSARGLMSGTPYIKAITPKKILEKQTSIHLIDDWSEEQIKEVVSAFRQL